MAGQLLMLLISFNMWLADELEILYERGREGGRANSHSLCYICISLLSLIWLIIYRYVLSKFEYEDWTCLFNYFNCQLLLLQLYFTFIFYFIFGDQRSSSTLCANQLAVSYSRRELFFGLKNKLKSNTDKSLSLIIT